MLEIISSMVDVDESVRIEGNVDQFVSRTVVDRFSFSFSILLVRFFSRRRFDPAVIILEVLLDVTDESSFYPFRRGVSPFSEPPRDEFLDRCVEETRSVAVVRV